MIRACPPDWYQGWHRHVREYKIWYLFAVVQMSSAQRVDVWGRSRSVTCPDTESTTVLFWGLPPFRIPITVPGCSSPIVTTQTPVLQDYVDGKKSQLQMHIDINAVSSYQGDLLPNAAIVESYEGLKGKNAVASKVQTIGPKLKITKLSVRKK